MILAITTKTTLTLGCDLIVISLVILKFTPLTYYLPLLVNLVMVFHSLLTYSWSLEKNCLFCIFVFLTIHLQVNSYKFMRNILVEVAYFIWDRDILSWWCNTIVLFFISIYQLCSYSIPHTGFTHCFNYCCTWSFPHCVHVSYYHHHNIHKSMRWFLENPSDQLEISVHSRYPSWCSWDGRALLLLAIPQ